MRINLLFLIPFVAALTTGKTTALQEDRNQPMVFEANLFIIDDKTGNHIYTGNVLMTQGSIIIKAEKLEILNRQGQPAHLIATGNQQADGRALFQQTTDERTTVKASAQKIEYHEEKSHLSLLGSAEFNRGQDVFKGHQIDYDTQTHRLIAGAPNSKNSVQTRQDNGRVHVTIYPKTEANKPTLKKETNPKESNLTERQLPNNTNRQPDTDISTIDQ